MTAREKIEAARAAASASEEHIGNAFARLGVRMMSEDGIYTQPLRLAFCLAAAIDELKKALRRIEGAPAITEADCAARDRESAGE